MTTVLIADDHAMVREGLRFLLEQEPEFTVVGEAGSGMRAINMCCELKPEVMVLDIMMGDINGIEVIRQVKESLQKIEIVILSMYGEKKYVLKALQAGARAYVIKKSVSSELVHAIRQVSVGRYYLSPALSDILFDAYLEKAKSGAADPYDSLSSREREVLHMVANGYNNTEISGRLCISRRTVETHRANAMRKLNLSSHTELIRYAIQEGILSLDI